MLKPPKHKHVEPPSLAEALNFSDEELENNRDGLLRPGQHDKLMSVANELRGFEVLIYLIAAIVSIAVIIDGVLRQDTVSSRLVMLGVVGAIAFAVVFFLHRHTARYQYDADQATVAAVQGSVILDFHDYSNHTDFVVCVSGETFSVDKATFLAFKSGDPYALYYVLRTRRLLSAEPLRNV